MGHVSPDVALGDHSYRFMKSDWFRPPEPEWLAEAARLAPDDEAVLFMEDRDGDLMVVLKSGAVLKRHGEAWHCVSRGVTAIVGTAPNLGATERLWTEQHQFFSHERLAASKTDLISDWIKANMDAYGQPGDEVYTEGGVQVTIRHFEPDR